MRRHLFDLMLSIFGWAILIGLLLSLDRHGKARH